MNDILFILLLFFLITSTLANPNLVKVDNPKGSKDSRAKQDIVVSIDKDQNFFIGSSAVPENMVDSLVADFIAQAKQKIDTPSVVINADTGAYYGEVFRIMRIAKRNGARVAALVK